LRRSGSAGHPLAVSRLLHGLDPETVRHVVSGATVMRKHMVSPTSATRAFKYDTAISFAGEDRTYAGRLAKQLKRQGLRVFFAPEREAWLWGKDEAALEKVYGGESRYVLPIVSRHYRRKDWTRFEFDAAKREASRRREEIILPIRLDDTPLLGLRSGVVYQSAADKSVGEIASLVAEKCRAKPDSSSQTPVVASATRAALVLLDPQVRRALALVASAPLPIGEENYRGLFPNIRWATHVPTLVRAGYLIRVERVLKTTPEVLKAHGADRVERRRTDEEWVRRLSGLVQHADTAAMLALHLLRLGNLERAARVTSDLAQGTHLGPWREIYAALLTVLAVPARLRRLKPRTQVLVLNGLGRCLIDCGRPEEALRNLQALRRIARRHGDAWGIGQSLINSGVAHHARANDAAAQQAYRRAITHARRTGDRVLLGRALSNLATTLQDSNAPMAQRLFQESVAAKLAARDFQGLAVSMLSSARLAASVEDFEKSAELYRQAAEVCTHVGLQHEASLAIYNQGCANRDAGRRRVALRLFAKAYALATDGGFPDTRSLAGIAYATGLLHERQFEAARDQAEAVLALGEVGGGSLTALHVLGLARLALGDRRGSRQALIQARDRACLLGDYSLAARFMVDSTRSMKGSTFGPPNLAAVHRMAAQRRSTSVAPLSGALWTAYAHLHGELHGGAASTEVFAEVARRLDRLRAPPSVWIELRRKWFVWAWSRGRFQDGLAALRRFADLKGQAGRHADAVAGMDQLGVCLQELGRHREALSLHRRAIRLASKTADWAQRQRSLNNLGEALRHLGRHASAIRVLEQAEKLARAAGHMEAAISTAHNRALALEAAGQSKYAEDVLVSCRKDAAREGYWVEAIRADEGLAVLYWAQGKSSVAIGALRRAVGEARRRGVRDNEARMCLSLARLHLGRGEHARGVLVLQPHIRAISRLLDADDYYSTLASLYAGLGRSEAAHRAWSLAQACARARGDQERVQEHQQHAREGSTTELGIGLRPEELRRRINASRSPARRGWYLLSLARVYDQRKSSRLAQNTLQEALRYCERNRLPEQCVAAYLMVGDSMLSGGRVSKREALRSFAAALAWGIHEGQDAYARAASHILFGLLSERSRLNLPALRRLGLDLERYLHSQPSASPIVVRFLLWPVVLAMRLLRFRTKPGKLLAELSRLASGKAISSYLSRAARRAAAGA
jgi:tetratricopeptide (TPR) repeat protein